MEGIVVQTSGCGLRPHEVSEGDSIAIVAGQDGKLHGLGIAL